MERGMCLLPDLYATDSINHAADVILDQYPDSSPKPALQAAVTCYQGVKSGHVIISNREPTSLSLHHYVQLEKCHSHCLQNRAK